MLVLVLAACKHESADGEDDDKPAAAQVTCQPVTATDIADTIEATGVIAPPPKVDAIVSSPIAGRVGQVAVEAGDRVEAGALLATIEDPALPAGTLEAKAGVAAAQAAKAAADQELARQERLVTAGIGARKDLDDARAKAAAAAAELDAANARAGVVLHVWKHTGESVDGTTATPVAEVADLTVLEVHAQVPPAALAPLRENMTASVRVLGVDGALPATVVRVEPAVDPATLLGMVRLRIDAKDLSALKIGSAATARIVIASKPGVAVPPSALRRSLVGADEVVVCDGATARVREVKVGQRDDKGVAIGEGVKPGERVVVDHVLGLQDGQPLTEKK